MKFFKKGLPLIISNPKFLFDKSARNIKFHFDLMHGRGNLDKAIDLLDNNNRDDFRKFVHDEVSFNPHNMFICRSKNYFRNIMKKYLIGFSRVKKYLVLKILKVMV